MGFRAAEALTLRRATIHLMNADGGNQGANARKEGPSVVAFDHSAKLPLHVPHVFAVVIEGDQPVFANLERAAEP